MSKKSLNQLLAESLNRLMESRNLSNLRLGQKARVAPNTIANYRKADGTDFTASGKERSAKLAEVERLAIALDVHPLYLLTDSAEWQQRAQAVALMMSEPAAKYTVERDPS